MVLRHLPFSSHYSFSVHSPVHETKWQKGKTYPQFKLQFSFISGTVALNVNLATELHGEWADDYAFGVTVRYSYGIILSCNGNRVWSSNNNICKVYTRTFVNKSLVVNIRKMTTSGSHATSDVRLKQDIRSQQATRTMVVTPGGWFKTPWIPER